MFSHAVRNQVRLRIQKDGSFQLVGPVIIMCQTAQTGLNPSNDDGGILIYRADQVAVNNRCVIRSFAHHAARCIGILLSAFLGNRIMVYHGIHVSGRYQKTKTWFS